MLSVPVAWSPSLRDYDFQREYFVRNRGFEDPDFELPCNDNGCLDLEELAYQELILRYPRYCCAVLIVKVYAPSADERRRQGVPANRQTMLPPVDARLSILKQLLS